ncbi:MAG: hypothetical protein IPI31_14390 [Bacteroidetes bacterium]|nr:hypothetical protein [Bacteroidota bacterium]
MHHPTTTSDLLTGNFRDFIRTRIDNSFEEHAIQMLFTDNDEEPENKEVWITEYNLHDGLELGDPTDPDIQTLENMLQPFESTVSNSLLMPRCYKIGFCGILKHLLIMIIEMGI